MAFGMIKDGFRTWIALKTCLEVVRSDPNIAWVIQP
jgi:hypothetical protein